MPHDITNAHPWMARGRCLAEDPELFFPATPEQDLAARAICATCPVADRCHAYALELHAQHRLHGIWAGMDDAERDQALDALDPQRCGTQAGYRRHRDHAEEPCLRCRGAWAGAERIRQRTAQEGAA